jgi:hypothetical protein
LVYRWRIGKEKQKTNRLKSEKYGTPKSKKEIQNERLRTKTWIPVLPCVLLARVELGLFAWLWDFYRFQSKPVDQV